jgi:signal peptidase I
MLKHLAALMRRLWPLYRVSGYSLWPLYDDGDYVLALHPLLVGRVKPGDVIVFHHPSYGTMIKQVEHVVPGSNDLYVVGTHEHSTDSREFGVIAIRSVIGKVVWHIRKPRQAA